MNAREKELIKIYRDDPKKFIERFFFIVDKNRQEVPFKFNDLQNKYYSERTHHDLILKSRKEGFSSVIEAIWAVSCLFIPHTRAVTISHEMESTKRHFERVRYFLDTMGSRDTKFSVEMDEESQKQIKFTNTKSTYWIGTAGTRAFGRGDDITHLHLSEVSWYQNQEVLTSAIEACVPNSWKVMETTANGTGEAFYLTWQEAGREGTLSPWKRQFFPWWLNPLNRVKVD